jgi:hypothetical protein
MHSPWNLDTRSGVYGYKESCMTPTINSRPLRPYITITPRLDIWLFLLVVFTVIVPLTMSALDAAVGP